VPCVTASDLTTTVLILAAAFIAPFLSDHLARWIAIPSVVLELLLGVLLGPVVLGWAHQGEVVTAISDLGLSMLMFLAGYEIDFGRIRGRPLRLAVFGWLISLAGGLVIALGIVTWLHGSASDDLVAHDNAAALVIGLAITTTALGTILPPLRDAGLLPTALGARVLAVGALGEFGPIVAVALLLTTSNPARTALLLVGFVVLALAGLWLATRRRPPRLARLITATLGTSTQVAVRLAMLVVVFMLWVALRLGLDALVGAFSAGIIIKAFLGTGDHTEAEVVESKLEGIGFGFLVPFFFVMSGVKLDLKALLSSPADAATIPVFLVLFLLVRGLPTLVLYRKDSLAKTGRNALALFASTQLPMVVVITSIGVQAGAIKASTAAALVTAGMLSVLIFPLIALRLAGRLSPVLEGVQGGKGMQSAKGMQGVAQD
jgi:Kef-type K+ transport system membrane component KefB